MKITFEENFPVLDIKRFVQQLAYSMLPVLLLVTASASTYAQHESINEQVALIKQMAAEEGYRIEDEGGAMVNYNSDFSFATEYFSPEYHYIMYAFTYTGALILLHFEDFKSDQTSALNMEVRSGDNGVIGAMFSFQEPENSFGKFNISSGTSERFYVYGLLFSKKTY